MPLVRASWDVVQGPPDRDLSSPCHPAGVQGRSGETLTASCPLRRPWPRCRGDTRGLVITKDRNGRTQCGLYGLQRQS